MTDRRTFVDVERELLSSLRSVLTSAGFIDGDVSSVSAIKDTDSVVFFNEYSNKDVAKYKNLIIYDAAKVGAMKYDDDLPRAFNAHINLYLITSHPLMSAKVIDIRTKVEQAFAGTGFSLSYLEESRDFETKRLVISYDLSTPVTL